MTGSLMNARCNQYNRKKAAPTGAAVLVEKSTDRLLTKTDFDLISTVRHHHFQHLAAHHRVGFPLRVEA